MLFEGLSSTKELLNFGRAFQFSFSKLCLGAAIVLLALAPKQGNNFGDLACTPTRVLFTISLIVMPEKCNIVCASHFSKEFILHWSLIV